MWTRNPAAKPNRPHFRRALTIWMAIDPADRRNGCLQVAPGSHQGPVVEHVMYDDSLHPELPRDRVEALDVEHIELGAGDAVVWHAHLWHYSPINASDPDLCMTKEKTFWTTILTMPAQGPNRKLQPRPS